MTALRCHLRMPTEEAKEDIEELNKSKCVLYSDVCESWVHDSY